MIKFLKLYDLKSQFYESKTTNYKENITVLKGFRGCSKKTSNTLDVGKKGLHYLIWEVVDNSIDEAMAGHCSEIIVTHTQINLFSYQIMGRGIPVDIHKEEGKSGLSL